MIDSPSILTEFTSKARTRSSSSRHRLQPTRTHHTRPVVVVVEEEVDRTSTLARSTIGTMQPHREDISRGPTTGTATTHNNIDKSKITINKPIPGTLDAAIRMCKKNTTDQAETIGRTKVPTTSTIPARTKVMCPTCLNTNNSNTTSTNRATRTTSKATTIT